MTPRDLDRLARLEDAGLAVMREREPAESGGADGEPDETQ